jgi:hypothetical protein
MTRGCTALTTGGPWGICSALWQMPGPTPGEGSSIAGCPITSTRPEGISHLIVTQGCGFGPGTVKAHPTTAIWPVIVATGWPLTSTRVCAGTMVAGPACVHWQAALR